MVMNTDSPIVKKKRSLISHLAVDARNQFAICLLRDADTRREDFGVREQPSTARRLVQS
jgi:hypothetical protein